MAPQTTQQSRARIVVPDDISGSYAQSTERSRLEAAGDLVIHATRAADEAELATRIADADVVLSFRPAFTKFPRAVIGTAPRLRMICISGTGVEDVDVAVASSRGIAVTNVVGSANRAVAEHCLALMFSLARSVPALDRSIRGGDWKGRVGLELGGKVLGIVGLSGIARELIPLARGLGMRVVSWSRNNDPGRAEAAGAVAMPLEEMLATADIVSLHVRQTAETRHMIDAERLARMKPGALLINTARGGVVDEAALIAALRSGRLGGAGLDVFAAEPLPAGHPFRDLHNVVITPVSAWNTHEASARMIGQSIDNVVAFLAGRPINVVNAAALAAAKG